MDAPTSDAARAILSSLFEYLCERNAVTHNPVKGVKRPPIESYQGKTPALQDRLSTLRDVHLHLGLLRCTRAR